MMCSYITAPTKSVVDTVDIMLIVQGSDNLYNGQKAGNRDPYISTHVLLNYKTSGGVGRNRDKMRGLSRLKDAIEKKHSSIALN